MTIALLRAPYHLLRRALGWSVRKWRQSLQLRVAASTAFVSGVVVLAVGVVLLGQISAGLLDTKRRAALAEADNGLRTAAGELAVASDAGPDLVRNTLIQLVGTLSAKGSNAGLFDVAILPHDSGQKTVASGTLLPRQLPHQLPANLKAMVAKGQQAYVYDAIRRHHGGSPRQLIIGEPLTSPIGDYGLYYLFPLQSEERTLALVQRTVLVSGIVLVFLVVAIAALVTRQVVRPVREASTAAAKLSAGHLEQRMPVRGEDELARLARAFNDMAGNLEAQITKLENLSRVQRRFTSDVSHELRTPLTTVRMAADVLYGAREDFTNSVGRSAELLQAELDRFESLLADLLEISRHDAQAAELEVETLDLRQVLNRVVDGVSSLAARAGSDVIVRVPAEAVVAAIDTRRVERILRNLLGNALEHGEGMPIEVTLASDEHAVAITVRDHGIGLRPEEAELVFNRFWRADPSRARHTGGTGLGLAISMEDARLHNGWLHAWGEPGKGAQFRLTLPIVAGTELESAPLPLQPFDASYVATHETRSLPAQDLRPGTPYSRSGAS